MGEADTYDEGELLVAAMTRPAMLSGLTLSSIGVSFFIPGMVAMITKSVYVFALIPVCLFIAYIVCLKDVYLFAIVDSYARVKVCVNKRLWGCRSYAPR